MGLKRKIIRQIFDGIILGAAFTILTQILYYSSKISILVYFLL